MERNSGEEVQVRRQRARAAERNTARKTNKQKNGWIKIKRREQWEGHQGRKKTDRVSTKKKRTRETGYDRHAREKVKRERQNNEKEETQQEQEKQSKKEVTSKDKDCKKDMRDKSRT